MKTRISGHAERSVRDCAGLDGRSFSNITDDFKR